MTKRSHSMYDQAKRAYMHGLTNSSQSVTFTSMSVVRFRSSMEIRYQAAGPGSHVAMQDSSCLFRRHVFAKLPASSPIVSTRLGVGFVLVVVVVLSTEIAFTTWSTAAQRDPTIYWSCTPSLFAILQPSHTAKFEFVA